MKKNSTFKDMVHVTAANVINLASSILNGFAVPVILGTLNYGYYKIFALYASYETLTHFGFNDGMLLSLSDKNFNNMNKYKCRSNILFFSLFQIILSISIASISFFLSNPFYKDLCILLALNNFMTNILCYYQKISQSMLRFNEYSIITIMQNSLLIVAVLVMYFIRKIRHLSEFNFIYYVSIVILIQIVLDLWYVYRYRSVTFGKHKPLNKELSRFKHYFSTGVFITFGWGIALLMFNLDSQFVIKFFSVRTYGIYAFAYSIISAGLIILQAASPVLLPHLKHHSNGYIIQRYSRNLSCIMMMIAFCIAGYFPLRLILFKFIPNYAGSLIYFRLLLPGIIITCCMNILISSYYFALNKMKFYFFMSLISLFIAFCVDFTFYIFFKTPTSLALASTISLIIWFLISNYFIVKWYKVTWLKNVIYLLLVTVIFLVISMISNWIVGLIAYLIMDSCISLFIFKKLFFEMLNRICDYIFNLI